MSGIALFNR